MGPWEIKGEYVGARTGDDMFEKLSKADAEAASRPSALADWSSQQWDISRQAVLDWWQGPPEVRLKATENTLENTRLIFEPASPVNLREESQRAFLKEVKSELSRIESLGKSGAPLSEDQLTELSRLTTDLEIAQSTRRPTEGSEEPMLIFSLAPRDLSRLPNGFSCQAEWIPGGLDPMWMSCSYSYAPAKSNTGDLNEDRDTDLGFFVPFAPSDRGGGGRTPPAGGSRKETPFGNILPETVKYNRIQAPTLSLSYSTKMTDEGTMLAVVQSLTVNNAPYGGRSGSQGTVFGLMANLKKYALDQGASDLIVYFTAENQQLDEFLSARYERLPSPIPELTVLRIPLGERVEEFSALDGTEGLPDSVTYPTPMPEGHLGEGFQPYYDAGNSNRESFPAHESRPQDGKACDGVAKPQGIEAATSLPGFAPHAPGKERPVSLQAGAGRGQSNPDPGPGPGREESKAMETAEAIEISRLTQAQRMEQAAASHGGSRSFSSFSFDTQPSPAPSAPSLLDRMAARTGEALSKTVEAVSQFVGSPAGQVAIGVAGAVSLFVPQVQVARGAYAVGAAALSLLGARDAMAQPLEDEDRPTGSVTKTANHDRDGQIFSIPTAGYRGINPPMPPVNYVYRGDARPPNEVFQSGFSARGTNYCLRSHVIPKPGSASNPNSGYVSTSISSKYAVEFPTTHPAEVNSINKTYLYQIEYPWRHAFHVEKTLFGPSYDISGYSLTEVMMIKAEQEIAVRSGIAPSQIKGAWEVKHVSTPVSGKSKYEIPEVVRVYKASKLISNPNALPPLTERIIQSWAYRVTKVSGSVLTGLGAIIDARSLYNAYSEETFFHSEMVINESARIVGGWGTAIGLGVYGAKMGGTLGFYLGGPVGATIGGFLGGAAGSVSGYMGGSWAMPRLIYDARTLMTGSQPLISPLEANRYQNQALNDLAEGINYFIEYFPVPSFSVEFPLNVNSSPDLIGSLGVEEAGFPNIQFEPLHANQTPWGDFSLGPDTPEEFDASPVSHQLANEASRTAQQEAKLMEAEEVIEISRLTQAQRAAQREAAQGIEQPLLNPGANRSFSSFDLQPPRSDSATPMIGGVMALAATALFNTLGAALTVLTSRDAMENQTPEEESAAPEPARATGPSSLPSQHELSLSLSVIGAAASALNLQETMLGSMAWCVSQMGGLALASVMPSAQPGSSLSLRSGAATADLAVVSARSSMESALTAFDRGRGHHDVASTFYGDMVRSSRASAGQDLVLREAYRGTEINISGRSGSWGHWSRDTGEGIASGFYSSAGFGFAVRGHSSFSPHARGRDSGGSDRRSHGPFGGRR
jgi:hypothetical protein